VDIGGWELGQVTDVSVGLLGCSEIKLAFRMIAFMAGLRYLHDSPSDGMIAGQGLLDNGWRLYRFLDARPVWREAGRISTYRGSHMRFLGHQALSMDRPKFDHILLPFGRFLTVLPLLDEDTA